MDKLPSGTQKDIFYESIRTYEFPIKGVTSEQNRVRILTNSSSGKTFPQLQQSKKKMLEFRKSFFKLKDQLK